MAAALATMLLAFSGAAIATAATTPSDDTYSGLAADEQQAADDSGGNGQAPAGTANRSTTVRSADTGDGTLPFTGFQIGIALVVGVALLGTGLVIRRVSLSGTHAS